MDWMRRQLADQRALATLIGSALQVDAIYADFAARSRGIISFDRVSVTTLGDDDTPRVAYMARPIIVPIVAANYVAEMGYCLSYGLT